jgi:AcrR family transcriptional regulator
MATRLGRPRQVEDDAIFMAMGAVFLRVGWPRLSLALVARELGITPAALRQRFGSKHDLLVAFYAWGTARLRDGLFASDGESHSPLETLRALIGGATAPFATPEQMVNALSGFTEVATEPDLRPMAQERFALTRTRLESVLQAAIASGELAPVDPGMLAQQLQSVLMGACLVWSISGDGELEHHVQQVVDAALSPYICEPRS